MLEKEIFEEVRKMISGFQCELNELNDYEDGRLASAVSENELRIAIKEYLETYPDIKEVELAEARSWYDIAIYYKDYFLPVNIKITTASGSDNISSKEGLFYALTGINPKKEKISYWTPYNKKLVEKYNPFTEADYYLIIYNKNTNKIFFSSLKRVNELTSNGNNLPFQCKWSEKNLNYSTRSIEEQCKYLMNVYIESWQKKLNTEAFEYLFKWSNDNNVD